MSRLLEYLSTTTWALHPAVMQRLSAIVERHVNGVKLDAETIASITANRARSKVARPDDEDYTIDRGVAVVPIRGVLQKHASMVHDISGPSGTSYETVRGAIRAARRDRDASAILLHIDSPGGVVDGVEDLAMEINDLRGKKPVYALADGMMASAALWLGVQAERVYATRGTSVGSVGVLASFTDTRRHDEGRGIDVRYLSSSANKGSMLTDQKLTSGQVDSILSQINAEHELFLEALARGRRAAPEAAARWGDGNVYLATKALELGLIDEVASYEQVIRAIAGSSKAGSAGTTSKGGTATLRRAQQQEPRLARRERVLRESLAQAPTAERELSEDELVGESVARLRRDAARRKAAAKAKGTEVSSLNDVHRLFRANKQWRRLIAEDSHARTLLALRLMRLPAVAAEFDGEDLAAYLLGMAEGSITYTPDPD